MSVFGVVEIREIIRFCREKQMNKKGYFIEKLAIVGEEKPSILKLIKIIIIMLFCIDKLAFLSLILAVI